MVNFQFSGLSIVLFTSKKVHSIDLKKNFLFQTS